MTRMTPPRHSFTSDENTRPTQPNVLWRSTPRTVSQDLTALMHTSTQPAVSKPPTPTTNKSAPQTRRPQCTHLTMNRVYGNQVCHVCGKVPSLGFLYACQQDHLPQIRLSGASTEALPVVPDHGNFFEAQAAIAKSLGMSTSVIIQMRAGEYSYEQIEILFAQRRRVKEVIRQAENPSTSSLPSSPSMLMNKLTAAPPYENIIASAGATIAPPVQQVDPAVRQIAPGEASNHSPVISSSNTATNKRMKKSMCNFQVCHACRPYSQDRVPMSVDSVLNGEVPAVSEAETMRLPVRNADILRTIGLRQPPQPSPPMRSSLDITSQRVEGNEDDLLYESTPTSSSWSEDDAEMCDSATFLPSQLFHETFDRYPCPGAGVCPVFSLSEGCAYNNGFDDGDRARHHGFHLEGTSGDLGTSSEPDMATEGTRAKTIDTPSRTPSAGSSISLPEPVTAPLTPTTPNRPQFGLGLMDSKSVRSVSVVSARNDTEVNRKRDYCLHPSWIRRNDSSSSLGSEVEVEGGVALTEEAVESGVPDIVTDEE